VAARLPVPADFAPPPDAATRQRWLEADRAARPERLARLRQRMAQEGVDAWFGVRPEHMRWLTGFALGPGEKPSAERGEQLSELVSRGVDASDEVLKSVEAGQRAAIEAVRKFLDTVNGVFPDVSEDGPRRKIIDAAFKMTDELVGASTNLAEKILKAVTSERPQTGAGALT